MEATTIERLRTLPGRDATLASHISHWRDWQVVTRCQDPCCPPNRRIAVQEVEAARGDVTVRGMVEGLRCGACGAAVGRVALTRHTAAGPVALSLRGAAIA